jgi:AcrR family transcriptional regulator
MVGSRTGSDPTAVVPPQDRTPEVGVGASYKSSPRETASAGLPAQRRELRAQGRRTLRRLLDAGLRVFARRGYHAARVDDIVRAARTSHGTFYLYFANKEDLFRALAAEVSDEMAKLADSLGQLEPGPDGEQSLRAWIDKFADLYEHYGAVIRAWTEAEIGSHEFGRLGTDVMVRFSRVLTQRVAEVVPPDIDPTIAAVALVAMFERLNYYAFTGQVRANHDQVVTTLARVTQRAVFGAGRPPSAV